MGPLELSGPERMHKYMLQAKALHSFPPTGSRNIGMHCKERVASSSPRQGDHLKGLLGRSAASSLAQPRWGCLRHSCVLERRPGSAWMQPAPMVMHSFYHSTSVLFGKGSCRPGTAWPPASPAVLATLHCSTASARTEGIQAHPTPPLKSLRSLGNAEGPGDCQGCSSQNGAAGKEGGREGSPLQPHQFPSPTFWKNPSWLK